MAKSKVEKIIESVELVNPDEVLDFPRIGMRITQENLTVERYQRLVAYSKDFEKHFKVKYSKPQKDEVETKG